MPVQDLDLAEQCAALLQAVRAEEPDAWERMLDAFGPLVLATARNAGLRGGDVEDVFQLTWMALHRSVPRIQEPGALVAWIGTTARRESWRRCRRRGPVVDPDTVAERETGSGPSDDPLVQLASLERDRVVREGVEALGDRCRELISRLFLEQDTPRYEDLADDMGMKLGSVGPTRIRCLAKLAAWLEERGVP